MAKKKKEVVEFRFYEVPHGEPVLALLGEDWKRVYGHEEKRLHFHNLMEIGICREGAGSVFLDQEEVRYETSTITIIPENYPHTTISEGENANFWEYIFWDIRAVVEELYSDSPVYCNKVMEEINKNPVLFQMSENPGIYDLIDRIMEEMRECRPCYEKAVDGYLRALVVEIVRRKTNLDNYEDFVKKGDHMMQISPALEYMNAHYSSTIRAGELAEVCHMSETHFRRIFEGCVNMAPIDYLNFIRIQKACEMMKKTNAPMDSVAEACGFVTTSTFNRNFRKFLNTSPYQWKLNPEMNERSLANYQITALKGW